MHTVTNDLRRNSRSQSPKRPLSTGPRLSAGKDRSRRNSLQHGLRANPSAGTIEDGGQFRRLLHEVAATIGPRNVIEEGLVHRITTCLWRLQWAAKV